MLVQTMNAITRRFQNLRAPARPDPLVEHWRSIRCGR